MRKASSRLRSDWWMRPILLATEPVSIQLRYLQTLTEIGVEKNTTIVFPLPPTRPKAAP
jgi:hypothetical protein